MLLLYIRVDAPKLRGSPVFGITVGEDGHVIEAAPIAKWTLGKDWSRIRDWFVKNGNATFELQEGPTC